MSRSGYGDSYGDDDNWATIRWRGAVASAFRGRRGQAFLREILKVLDAMPEKRLIKNAMVDDYDDKAVCTFGAVGKSRGLDMSGLDPEDPETVAHVFGIAQAMVHEIVYVNDEWERRATPEERYARMRQWVGAQIHGGDNKKGTVTG